MLKPKHYQAITLLLTTPQIGDVCKQLGISRMCLRDWLMNKEFALEYHRAIRWMYRQSMSKVLSVQDKAIETALALMDDEDGELRLKAAKLMLDHSVPAYVACDDANHADLTDSELITDGELLESVLTETSEGAENCGQ